MAEYNLMRESWIPFRRQSGAVIWGDPATLTDGIGDDPIVAISAPRPDFNGALQEFLIGLLSAGFELENERAWEQLWKRPPTAAELRQRLQALAPAFALDGDGPRFMQDFSASDFADCEPVAIEQILIDAPGGQTAKLNKDLFIKRDRIARMGRPAAAMALITLQTYAPAGGQGHRTSLRGGGPLTTLVNPEGAQTGRDAPAVPLWHKLWANVSTVAEWRKLPGSGKRIESDRFPWLAPTRVSSKPMPPTTAEDAHPLQAYFGMPRRIRLIFGGPGRCDLTGLDEDVTVEMYQTKNYGVEYSGWHHPLSPYYRTKVGEPLLPVHGQPGGLSWRDWINLMFSEADSLREPATVVSHYRQERLRITGLKSVSVHAFGYDMDNMKARGWVESRRPLLFSDDPDGALLLASTARSLADGTDLVARELMSAGKTALFQRSDDARGDVSQYRSEVWDGSEAAFFDAMRHVASGVDSREEVESVSREFLGVLESVTLATFDRWCPMAAVEGENVARLVRARYGLVTLFRGRSRSGAKLFEALRLPTPELSARRSLKPQAKEKR